MRPDSSAREVVSPSRRARATGVGALLPAFAVAAGTAALALGGAGLATALRYQRDAVLDGELWRLLTGNLVHLGPAHLLLNLGGLALIVALFRDRLTAGRWCAALAASGMTTTLGLAVFHPDIAWYVGLSGVLHGLFVAGAVTDLRHGRRGAWLYLALVGAKLLAEGLWGAPPETVALIDGPVVVAAHAYGAAGGLLALAWRQTPAVKSAGA